MEEVSPQTEHLLAETGWTTPVKDEMPEQEAKPVEIVREKSPTRSNSTVSLNVMVSDPIKQGEGAEAYTVYLVTTTKSQGATTSVRRRFSDFVWLHKELLEEFPSCVIPPIPGKQQMKSYVTGSRFDPMFVEKRMRNLQTFVDRVVRHPKLHASKRLEAFLSPEPLVKTVSLAQQSSFMDNVSESLLHTFGKSSPRKQDERSEPHRIQLGQLEDSISRAERAQIRLARANRTLASCLHDLSTCTSELSKMETGMGANLSSFAQTLASCANDMGKKGKEEEIGTVSALHMYIGYCEAVKDLLKLRDQKQVEAEALSDYLTKAMTDRDRYSIPGKTGGGLAGWVKGQYDERVRGVDPERSRLEQLAKLERKVASLQVAVQEGAMVSNAFGDSVAEEVNGWSVTRQSDVRDMLKGHAQVQVEFHEANLALWDKLIPELEKDLKSE